MGNGILNIPWFKWVQAIGLAIFCVWALLAAIKSWKQLKVFRKEKRSGSLQKGIFNLSLSLLCAALFIKTGVFGVEFFASTFRAGWSLLGVSSFLATTPCGTQSVLAWTSHQKLKSAFLGIAAIVCFLTAIALF